MVPPLQMRTLSTRVVPKLEKPRPLKISSSQNKETKSNQELSYMTSQYQEVLSLVESVNYILVNLSETCDEILISRMVAILSKLKIHGQQMEAICKDKLDKIFRTFQECCHNDSLPGTIRLYLLELLGLRANQWTRCDKKNYSQNMLTPGVESVTEDLQVLNTNSTLAILPAPYPPSSAMLGPKELKTSEIIPQSPKIPEKSYYNGNVVVQNSDSKEYKCTVTLGKDSVQITGSNHKTVKNVRQMLEEDYEIWLQKKCIEDNNGYKNMSLDPLKVNIPSITSVDSALAPGFGNLTTTVAPNCLVSSESEWKALLEDFDLKTPPRMSTETSILAGVSRAYSRDFLLECSFSIHSNVPPPNWDQIALEYPEFVKK